MKTACLIALCLLVAPYLAASDSTVADNKLPPLSGSLKYDRPQKGWRHAKLVVDHLGDKDEVVATSTMEAWGLFSWSGVDETNDSFPMTIELRGVSVDYTDFMEPSESYRFTSKLDRHTTLDTSWSGHWFQWLLFQPVQVRVDGDRRVDLRYCDTGESPFELPPQHVAIVEDAARLLVHDFEFAFFKRDLGQAPIKGWFSLPVGPSRSHRFLATIKRCESGNLRADFELQFDGVKAKKKAVVIWDEDAVLNCRLSEEYTVWNAEGNGWDSATPWRIPNHAKVKLTMRSYSKVDPQLEA